MERSEAGKACEVWEHNGRELRIFPGRNVNGRQLSSVIMGPFSIGEIAELLTKRMETVSAIRRQPRQAAPL